MPQILPRNRMIKLLSCMKKRIIQQTVPTNWKMEPRAMEALKPNGGTLAGVWPAGLQDCSGPVTPSISPLFELECL